MGITYKFSSTIIVAEMVIIMIIMAIYVALGTPLMVGLGIGTSLQPLLFVLLVLVTTTTIFLAKNVAVYRQHSPDK